MQQSLRSSRRLRSALAFAALAGGSLTVYFHPSDSEAWSAFFAWYLSAYARAAAALLRVFDAGVTASGPFLIGRVTFQIVRGCDAMDVLILVLSAIVVLPCRWRSRLHALPFAVVLVVALNLIRICSLYFVQIYAPDAFELVHMELWPMLLVTAAAAGFWLWARRATAQEVSK